MPRSPSTRWPIASAVVASTPATTAATISGWPCSRSAKAGTTTTISFPAPARQGFRWWEVDLTWYGLKLMAMLGLVRGLKPVPAWVLAKAEG